MSIPPVTKDILEHPKAGSVAASTDKADVSIKINTYGVNETFYQGSMLDNHQIDETLQFFLKTLPLDKNKLSPDGRKLAQDACEIIETARLIVTEKNADEFFQYFIWNTRDISLDNVEMDAGALSDEDCQNSTSVHHLRTILSLILTNSEVRKLISELSVIGRKGTRPDASPSKAQGKKREENHELDEECFSAETGPDASLKAQGEKREENRERKFLDEEYFPGYRRDPVINQGKKVIIECQKHTNFTKTQSDGSSRKLGDILPTGKLKAKNAEDAFNAAMPKLRILLERFADHHSMDGFVDAFDALIDRARCDDQFRSWLHRLNRYIHKVLFKAGFVLKVDCNREGNKILESGRHFWNEKYKEHFDNLIITGGEWFAAVEEDPLNKRLGEDWARLMHDLLFDSEGSLKFKADLWSDVAKVILPTMMQQVERLPILRIEYTDDAFDIVVDNLSLEGWELLSGAITIEGRQFLNFSPVVNIPNSEGFTITLTQIKANMRDVDFYSNKKTGYKLCESGIADVILDGRGMEVTINLVSADKDSSSVFEVKDVHVKVHSLKLRVRGTRHDAFYNTMRSFLAPVVKSHMEKVVGQAIRTGLRYLSFQGCPQRAPFDGSSNTSSRMGQSNDGTRKEGGREGMEERSLLDCA
ncbi:hypothetical protein BDR04DRAFT_1147674 [Suillus decipiens]|nr:hypothetical protein BDR04DRAFT_1147674 [Suillus decipiens]